jgi:biotin carboxyl carrier protein
MTATLVHGEELRVPERVIVAPALGVFRLPEPESSASEGDMVTEGQVVGVVVCNGSTVDVRSPFTGHFMGMLAHPGERVREGQPVAWLRLP